MRLVGISREKENSPGRHLSNDALVLAAVADRLRERDLAVDVVTIDRATPRAAVVFSMCQGRAAPLESEAVLETARCAAGRTGVRRSGQGSVRRPYRSTRRAGRRRGGW